MKVRSENAKEVLIVIADREAANKQLSLLKSAVRSNQGSCPVKLVIRGAVQTTIGDKSEDCRSDPVIALPDDMQVAPSGFP